MKHALFIITQANEDAPVVSETVYNTIGETPSFTYLSEGEYEASWPSSGTGYTRRICQVGEATLGTGYNGWKCSQHGDLFQQFDAGELSDGVHQCVLLVTMF